MATNILKVQIKQAVKTEAEWSEANPVIPDGVFAYSSDSGLYKIGNGTSKWSALEYAMKPINDDDITTILNTVFGEEG